MKKRIMFIFFCLIGFFVFNGMAQETEVKIDPKEHQEVVKSIGDILEKNYVFPEVAKKFGILVIMCNAVGPSDNFLSVGQSAAWDEQGNLLAMLNDSQEALLVIDVDGPFASCRKIEQGAITLG